MLICRVSSQNFKLKICEYEMKVGNCYRNLLRRLKQTRIILHLIKISPFPQETVCKISILFVLLTILHNFYIVHTLMNSSSSLFSSSPSSSSTCSPSLRFHFIRYVQVHGFSSSLVSFPRFGISLLFGKGIHASTMAFYS